MVHVCGWYGIVLVSFSEIGKIRSIFSLAAEGEEEENGEPPSNTTTGGWMYERITLQWPEIAAGRRREREREGEKGEQKYKSLHA